MTWPFEDPPNVAVFTTKSIVFGRQPSAAGYLATLPDALHVFHAFQKKTRKTSRQDIEIARDRYRAHMRSLKR